MGMIRLERQGDVVAPERFLRTLQAGPSVALVEMGPRMGRPQGKGAIKIRKRLGVTPQILQAAAPVVVRLGKAGIALDGGVKVPQGFRMPAHLLQDGAPVVAGRRPVRRQADGAIEAEKSLPQALLP